MRGDIETPWAGRAKEYSWSLCLNLAPRKITPTDIDYLVECKNKFAFFEMKTIGAEMPFGQQLMFKNLLRALPGQSMLFVVEHTQLNVVHVPVDVIKFHCRMANKEGLIRNTDDFHGSAFPGVYKGFFDWAESGNLDVMREAFEIAKHKEWIADYDAELKRLAG